MSDTGASESGEKSEKQQRTPLRFRNWAAIAFLMALGLLALYNTNNEWRSARTAGQAVATLTELVYGVCAILGTVAGILLLALPRRASSPTIS